MIRKVPLRTSCRSRFNELFEWNINGWSTESSGPPFFQVIAHKSFARPTEDQPWLPCRTRDHRQLRVLLVSKFRTVPTTKRVNRPRDLPAQLEARGQECGHY